MYPKFWAFCDIASGTSYNIQFGLLPEENVIINYPTTQIISKNTLQRCKTLDQWYHCHETNPNTQIFFMNLTLQYIVIYYT